MKISDSEIINSLLGNALPEFEDQRHVVTCDADTAERFRQWSSVLSRMQIEREAHLALQNRAMGRVMQRIAGETRPVGEGTFSTVEWRSLIRPTRMRVGGLLAVAAGTLLIAGYFALTTVLLESSAVPAQVASTEPAIYLDFGFEGEGIGTDSQPYATLSEAIGSVRVGGLLRIKTGESREAIRIAKPMRLEAIGGSARIGNL